jgi:hypothetical protein
MKTKICSICGLEKPVSEFAFSQGRPKSYCKLCDNERNRLYRRTLSGHLHKIYNNQKRSSIQRGHSQPTYTFDELKEWFISQPNWEDLWLKWENSNYTTQLAPSIDRLDESKGYSLDNIRLVTWYENCKKEHHRQGKKVNQYDLDGNYLRTFDSITDALKALNKSTRDSHITLSCKGEQNHTFGYQWRYLSEEFPLGKNISPLPSRERVNGLPKKVKAILPNGEELVFDSLAKAGEYFNCSKDTIARKIKTGRTRIAELKDVKLDYLKD